MTNTLSLCDKCNCMTKTIVTANTPVCGKCKEIRTNSFQYSDVEKNVDHIVDTLDMDEPMFGWTDNKETLKQFLILQEKRIRRDEQERIIEIIKCLYEGNDAPIRQQELIDIINGEFIEPWQKKLANKKDK